MLTIIVKGDEHYNEETSEFFTVGDVTLELEHSLVSVSKWESKYQVPFLSGNEKTNSQTFYYIKCMLLTKDIDEEILRHMSKENYDTIQQYIESTESATHFAELPNRKGPGEVITSELIYYWMVAFTIPFDCETWHINRLFSLIRICNMKQNTKQRKMSKRELSDRYRSLNEARKAEFGTRG